MSSPIEVFRNLSGMFSPQPPPPSAKSPKFSIFGSATSIDCSRWWFETPKSVKSKIPINSTPIKMKQDLKSALKRSIMCTSILEKSNISSQMYDEESRTDSLRARRFGVSDTMVSSKIKIGNASIVSSYSHISTRTCNVFSASFTPCNSPTVDYSERKRLLRLGGLALSPSSVSWTSESPVLPLISGRFTPNRKSKQSKSPPNYFLWNKYNLTTSQDVSTGGKRRLHDSVETCPPGKLYFWEDDENEIITEDQLGRGGFGRVFEGTYRGQKVAIKKLETYKSRQALVETLHGELIGLRLQHANVVRTLVIVQPRSPLAKNEKNHCYIVMEHAGSRNLSQLINDPSELIPIQRSIKFAADILSALTYFHQRNFAHLDLKPSNVIVTPQDVCKICDFGSCQYLAGVLSQEQMDVNSNFTSDSISNSMRSSPSASSLSLNNSSSKSSSQLMGTFIYRAPELLRGLVPTTKSDMFSFSITAWQIWSRVLPYSGQHNHATVFAVVSFGARPQMPTFSPPHLSDSSVVECSEKKYLNLVQSCWAADPGVRPSAEKAYATLMHKPNDH